MGRLHLRDVRWAAAGAAVAVAVAGCGSGGGGSSGTADRELTVAVPSAVTSLNPVKIGTGIPDQFFVQPAYDSLIVRAANGDLVPGLAAEWGYTDDKNQAFQIKLRDGVKFSDGSPLNAEAVKQWMEWFKNANGLFSSRFAGVTNIEVNDPLTLTMHLAESDAAWPESLTQDRYGYVVSPNGIADQNALGTGSFGAGPYVLDSAATVSGSTYVYNRNPLYWNPAGAQWDKVVVKVIPDATARLSAIQSGQADVAIGDSTTAASAGTGRSAVKVVTAPYLWNTLTILDRGGQLVPALGDARVRQALNYAVDRPAVAKAVFRDYGDPNVSMLTSEFRSFSADAEGRYFYDPERARQLLAEAGFPTGFTLDVLVWNRNGLESTFTQALTGYYDKIGVKLDLHQLDDAGAVVSALQNKQYPAFTFFGQIEEANLLIQEQLLPQSGVLNPFQYTDRTLIANYQQYHQAPAGPAQDALLKQLQSRIVDQGYYVQVSTSDEVYFHTDDVMGLDVSAAEPIMNLHTLRPTQASAS